MNSTVKNVTKSPVKGSGTSAKKARKKAALDLVHVESPVRDYLFVREDNTCRPLSEKDLSARIPNFESLPARKRRRKANALINRSIKIVAKLGNNLNAPKRVHEFDGSCHLPMPTDYRAGAIGILSMPKLCPSDAGLRFFDTVICGLQATSLTERFPGVKLHLYFKDGATTSLIKDLLQVVICKESWQGRHCVLTRNAVIDYRVRPWELSPRPVDCSRLTIKGKGKRKLSTPFPYQNTIVAVIGADKKHRGQMEDLLQDTAVIFLGGPKPKGALPVAIDKYDADVLTQLQAFAPQIAALCRLWQKEQPLEYLDGFVEEVYAAMPHSEGRLRPVKPDPDALREAVFNTVRMVFLRFLVDRSFITPEEATAFLESLMNPEPVPTEVSAELRNVSDPTVFLDVMRQLIADNPDRIVQLGQPYREVKQPIGAWRTISGEDHFVMLEETFQKEFLKAAKAMAGVDLSYFKGDWLAELLKQLKPTEVIKTTGSNYRYRYALVDGRKREDTYVVAIPKSRLDGANEEVLA